MRDSEPRHEVAAAPTPIPAPLLGVPLSGGPPGYQFADFSRSTQARFGRPVPDACYTVAIESHPVRWRGGHERHRRTARHVAE